MRTIYIEWRRFIHRPSRSTTSLWIPAAVAAQFAPLISAFPDWHWEIRHLFVDGDYVALHFKVTGTHRGTFQGIQATGRRVTISQFTLYRVQDDKFAEVWDVADMDAVVSQIGQDATGGVSR